MRKLLPVLMLGGCVSTSQPVQIGPDTYSVSATADGFRTTASAKNTAYNKARALCDSKGLDFYLVDAEEYRTRMGIDTTIDVIFRCGPRS